MKTSYKKGYFNKTTEKNKDIFNFYLNFLRDKKIDLKNKNICDIGCAHGFFLEKLMTDNICYGFDISEYVINECKKNTQVYQIILKF